MKIDLGNIRIRFSFSISKTVSVAGVNSNIDAENTKHILLWDFDNTPYSQVVNALKRVQQMHSLPTIHIIESSPKHYHAYCFMARTTSDVILILSSTPFIDQSFFKFGIIRGYWTLRITPKRTGQSFHLVNDLWSSVPDENIALSSLLEVVKYKTGG